MDWQFGAAPTGGTVAILAQGTTRAVAVTQAFFGTRTCSILCGAGGRHVMGQMNLGNVN